MRSAGSEKYRIPDSSAKTGRAINIEYIFIKNTLSHKTVLRIQFISHKSYEAPGFDVGTWSLTCESKDQNMVPGMKSNSSRPERDLSVQNSRTAGKSPKSLNQYILNRPPYLVDSC